MQEKEKRRGLRVPILSGSVDLITLDRREKCEVYDLSTTGLFLKNDKFLKPQDKALIELHLPSDLGILALNSEVVWIKWAKSKKDTHPLGMGFRFNTSAPQQKILDAYVNYVRNKQIIAVSKRIIEEFFGDPNKSPPIPNK